MKKVYNNILLIAIPFLALSFLSSCSNNEVGKPGYEFMPDMYRATGYEAYLKKFDIDSADFFERNLDKLSSGTWKITGSLENPKTDFEGWFEN